MAGISTTVRDALNQAWTSCKRYGLGTILYNQLPPFTFPAAAANKIPKYDAAGTALEAVAYGSASNTVAQGNDGRFPTSDEKAALAGTGTPSAANKYVTADTIATPISSYYGQVSNSFNGGVWTPADANWNKAPFFDEASFAVGFTWDAGNTRISVTNTGKYYASYGVTHGNTIGAACTVEYAIYVNGAISQKTTSKMIVPSFSYLNFSKSVIISITAGQYVELFVKTPVGLLTYNDPVLNLHYLGA